MKLRVERDEGHWVGVALSVAAGLGAGLLVGRILGDTMGSVDSARVKGAVRRLRRRSGSQPPEAGQLQHAVEHVLQDNPTTRDLGIQVRALGDGLIELVGSAPDPTARHLAGDLARGIPEAVVVVNRILVDDSDDEEPAPAPPTVG